VSLEISLLTPLKRLHDWRKWEPGYGAVLLHGDKGGLLLPQVAHENNWNRDQFLPNLALKAGLPPNGFRDARARLYVFRAQTFAEPDTAAFSDRQPDR
jgi:AMMECR1 domain-containing protein